MEFFTSELAWLFFAYAIGTAFGLYSRSKKDIELTTEAVIDTLIDQGYLKTEGQGKNVDIIRWEDWCNDQVTGQTAEKN